MRIQPFRPLILPLLLLVIIAVIAILLPTFKPVDDAIIRLVQQTPRDWEPAVLLITKLGDVPNLIFVAAIVAIWEVYRRNYVRSLVMLGSLIALPSFYIIKEIVGRARPVSEFLAQNELHGYSFPSGHSSGTMAVYGMLTLLAYSHLYGWIRQLVVGAGLLVILLVSFSRVYLGAHYPTDVFAGWLLGIVVISLLRTASLIIAQKRSQPNQEALDDTTEAKQ